MLQIKKIFSGERNLEWKSEIKLKKKLKMAAFSGKFVFPSFLLEYDVKMSWYWSPEQREKQDSVLKQCLAGHVLTFLLAFLLSIISVPCVCGQRKRWSDFSSSK